MNIKWLSWLVIGMVGFCLSGCSKGEPPETRLVVSEQVFEIRELPDEPPSFVIDARGRIKNVGEYDAKRVVVTGNCISCGEQILMGQWFTSRIEKTEDQKDTINYIARGSEEEFHFTDVALMVNNTPEPPDHMPEKFEIIIESYDTVVE